MLQIKQMADGRSKNPGNPAWKKGQSGNPKGRPKGTGKNQLWTHFKETYKKANNGRLPKKGEIAYEAFRIMKESDDEKIKLQAASKLIDMIFEKPKEQIDHTISDERIVLDD